MARSHRAFRPVSQRFAEGAQAAVAGMLLAGDVIASVAGFWMSQWALGLNPQWGLPPEFPSGQADPSAP